MDSLFAYVTLTAVLVLTPGSTTAVIVRNTLVGGRLSGLKAAMGAAIGNTSHATAAGLGLAVVFTRWPLAMSALRVGGAIYLGWLGVRCMYRVVKHPDGGLQPLDTAGIDPRDGRTRATGFRQGLIVNLVNPAIATFYLVVVPSFLPDGAPPWYFAGLAAVHIAMAFACHSLWAVALDRVRRELAHPGARRLLEAATGVALLILALHVLIR